MAPNRDEDQVDISLRVTLRLGENGRRPTATDAIEIINEALARARANGIDIDEVSLDDFSVEAL